MKRRSRVKEVEEEERRRIENVWGSSKEWGVGRCSFTCPPARVAGGSCSMYARNLFMYNAYALLTSLYSMLSAGKDFVVYEGLLSGS